jgi:hypothetical protein
MYGWVDWPECAVFDAMHGSHAHSYVYSEVRLTLIDMHTHHSHTQAGDVPEHLSGGRASLPDHHSAHCGSQSGDLRACSMRRAMLERSFFRVGG